LPTYALLLRPSANRVYADAATALMRAELGVLDMTVCEGRLGSGAGTTGSERGIATEVIGGLEYLTFEVADPAGLSGRDVAFLGTLSAAYALFERVGGLLRPVETPSPDRFDDDLVTIPKYAGKTNEQFTKLLLNVTIWSSARGAAMLDRRLHVFDPLCGRGTTLNQAMLYGYDASGMDIDGKDFDAYAAFLRTYLRRKRLKHTAEVTPIRRDRAQVGRRLAVTVGRDKREVRTGEGVSVTVVNADATKARDFFRPRSVDVVVTDAPYGVQHGSRAGGGAEPSRRRGGDLRRGPLELLRAALPGWAEILRPGGALGLSWNTHVAGRDDVASAVESAGLDVCTAAPYTGLRHRVDQAIDRDVVVARKPG